MRLPMITLATPLEEAFSSPGPLRNASCRLQPSAWTWLALALGVVALAWFEPRLDRPGLRTDVLLAPAVVLVLLRVLGFWTSPRVARLGALIYALQLGASLCWLDADFGGLAARNLSCAGSAELLVSLSCLDLLLARSVPPMAWCAIALLGTLGHPQYVFCPLLLMILVRPAPLLRAGLAEHMRACAVRCSLAAAVVLQASALARLHSLRVDAVLLPAAWWIGSWLMVEEIFMPVMGRVLTVATFCACTVADFRPWPGLAVCLMLACAAMPLERRS